MKDTRAENIPWISLFFRKKEELYNVCRTDVLLVLCDIMITLHDHAFSVTGEVADQMV